MERQRDEEEMERGNWGDGITKEREK